MQWFPVYGTDLYLDYIIHFIHGFKKALDLRQKRRRRHSLNNLVVPCVAKSCFYHSTKGKYLIDHRSEGGGEIIQLILLCHTCNVLVHFYKAANDGDCRAVLGALFSALPLLWGEWV